MIEVIYEADKTEEKDKANEFKMPKNIRQIGTPDMNRRIYIEDYVVTYLGYLAKPGITAKRGAILLGNVKHIENTTVIFINAAIDCESIDFELDEGTFSKEIWQEIYDSINENFPGASIVGWFLSRMGYTTAVNDKMLRLHVDNFPGREKVLYIMDSLEMEEAFYMFDHGELRKQQGYYIYYEKNEPMQNYIIKQRGNAANDEEDKVDEKDKSLMKKFREKNEQYENASTRAGSFVYVAGTFFVVCMLAMGVTILNNYDKMKDLQISLNRLELLAKGGDSDEIGQGDANQTAISQTGTDPVVITNVDGTVSTPTENESVGVDASNSQEVGYENSSQTSDASDVNGSQTSDASNDNGSQTAYVSTSDANQSTGTASINGNQTTDAGTDVIFGAGDSVTDGIISKDNDSNNTSSNASNNIANYDSDKYQDKDSDENFESAPASAGVPVYYEIKAGDTLTSISIKYFDSIEYIEDIAKANKMDVNDCIYEGEKIIIPSIE